MQRLVALLVLVALWPLSASAVSRENRDEFTTGVQGWQPTLTTATPGPNGASDPYLVVQADGTGMKGRMVAYNTAQWAGNYTAAGVQVIAFQAKNLGATSLSLRIAVGDSTAPNLGGSWLATSAAVPLPAGSGWQPVSISIGCADLVAVQGTATCAQVLGNVVALRILSSALPAAQGDVLVGVLGLDRITTVPSIPLFPALEGAR